MAQNTFLQSPFDALAPQTDTSIYTLPSLPGSEPVKPQEVPDVTRAAPAQAAQPVAEPEPVKAPPRRQAATSNLLPPAQYAPIFEAAAREFDVPVNVLMALGHQESRYNTAAIGQTTQWGRAKGMMQYLDSTASGLGINPFSAEESIPAAARQIRERLDKGYSMEDAVKEHFAGPNRKLWGEKTAAYGREVMEKVGKIGELLGSGATAPAATDPLADLNKSEPGRYRMATPEQVAEFEARQAAAAGKSDNLDKEAAAQQKAIDERGFFDRAGAAASSGYDNMVQSLNTAKFVIGGGDSMELARALSDKFAEQQKAQRTTGQKEMDAAFKEVTDAKGVVDTTLKGAKAIYTAITNPKDLAVDAIEQLPNMLPTLGAGAAGAGGGAAVGAGAGALAAGVGAAPGAIAGAIWGGRTGMLAGTAATELGAEVEYLIGKQLEESRRAPTPENIKAILDSPGFIAAARDQGLKKGLTVAVIDQLFLGLGGKVAGKAGKAATVGGKAAYGAGAVALDATGEVVGESASQKVARGEVDAGDALKEGVIGLGQSVVEPVVGAGMQAAKKAGQAMRPTAPASRVEPTVPPVAAAPVAPGSQAPSEPVATAAPSPSGPLTGAVEKAAGATEQPPRVSVVAPEGEVTGFMQSMREDGQGGFTARVLGDDGQVYTFTSADGVTITPLAPEPAGPLTAAVDKVAEQAPSTPAQAPSVSEAAPNIPAEGVALAPAVQDAQEAKGAEIKAAFDSLSGGGTTDDLYNKAFDALKAGKSTISGVKDPILSRAKAAFDAGLIGSPQDIRAFEQNGYPEVQPAPQAAPSLTDMTEPELRERLKYIASQGKANGWNKMLTNARREVEREINRRAEGATTDARPDAVAAGVRDEAAGGVQADAPAGVDQPAGRDGAAQLRDVGSADTGAPVPQDGAAVPAASDAADGQPALTKKQSAALDRIAKGTANFGSQEKAEAFIAKNDIGDTHEVVQTGKVRFEVKAKAPATAEESSTVQAEATPAIVPAGGTTTADEREPERRKKQSKVLPREMDEDGMAKDGKPINPGDVFKTLSGRETSPYPKQKSERYASEWLIENAASEAESRGDEFNSRTFRATKPNKSGGLTTADRESMLMYLFGYQPAVVPSILKPLSGKKPDTSLLPQSESQAVRDFLDGKRPDAPTLEDVAAENKPAAEEAVRLAKQRAGQKPEVPTVSENKVFTEDAAAKARALLRSKLGQLNTGIDPEVMQAGITLAGYHIEKGARTFAAYAKTMIEDLGDVVKPYLKSWYMGVKYDPRAAGFDGMSDAAEVEGADVDALLKSAPSAPQPSGNLMDSFYQAISAGSMPSDNNALRKMVSDFDGAPADNARLKIAQEALEAAIARRARDIVAEGGDVRQTYDKLVDLYQSQPNLNIRTSTSIENQAYSTPAPLSYVSAKLAGIDANTTVYEPTAGNGMLLITADPKNATANELEDTRFENLKAQGFDAIQGDALDVVSSGAVAAGSQDAVITNPPFGSVKDESGKATKVSVDGYKIGKIDHLIAAEALKAMRDGGKATLIIGADKAAGGVSTDDRIFFNWLYGNYNVTSHFEVDGKLYSRQGASWPVRVITVDGRRKSSNVSPRPGEVQRVGTWEEVYEQYQQGLDSQVADDRGAAVGADGAVQRDRADDAGTASQPAGAEARRDGAAKPRARKDGAGDVAGERAGAVRTGDAGAAERVAGAAGAQRGDGAPAVADRLADGAAEDRPAGGKARADRPARDAGADRVENQFQASYVPRSSRKDEGVLIPVNMAQPTQDALNALEDEVGDIDEYAMRELGYPSKAALHDALMGLQVDSVASAIYQMGKGKGVIIADQCVAAGTRIYDPISGEHTAIEVLAERGQPIHVLSLGPDGLVPAVASAPFKKGVSDLYRVTLDDGREITVTRNHRFLTPDGWQTLAQGLSVGSLLVSAEVLPERSSGACLSTHDADAPRSTGTLGGSPENCSAHCHQCDEQPHGAQGAGQASSLQQVGAPARIRLSLRLDDQDTSQGCSHQRPLICRHSRSSSSPLATLDLSSTSGQALAFVEISSEQTRQSVPLFGQSTEQPHQQFGEALLRQHGQHCAQCAEQEFSSGEAHVELFDLEPIDGEQLIERIRQLGKLRKSAEQEGRDWSPCADYTGYGRIQCIQYVRRDEFFDMWVPGFENYVAEGFVNHNTGIGKGRQAASIIRWAKRKGFVPVFVTVKPQLFTDMFNDLADIGSDDIAPFIMNTDEWIANAAGEKLFANKKSTHRKTLGDIAATGELPEGRNALFLTYSQINTENIQRTVLSSLAGKAIFILDESHNAGGQSQTGEYMRETLGGAAGVTYLSATYAKRPDNMPVYFKTDIGMAISDDGQLMDAMAAGGLPLQTVVSNNLVKAGQMFRRERSYDGVSISTIVATERRAEHEKLSDAVTEALRGIVDADRAFHNGFVEQMAQQLAMEGAALKDIAGNQASQSVNHTEFSSVVHNFVRQLLLGLKADAAADRAIEAIKAGEKPLIAVENTMGSFLAEYAAAGNIRPGQPLGNFDYRTVLSRALERSRVIVIKDPTGNDTKRRIELSELDPVTRDAYDRAQAVIDGLELDIPVSPIDWMRNRIQQAGYTVAEITGRNLTVDYSEGAPKLSQLPTDEQNDKVGTTRKFNDGRLDAIILNVSGSTGISLHASEKFKDQRPRRMVVAQAAQDINIFMQMLGRIHRTGQVKLPSYEILSVDLPAEKRPTSILSNKMKSLNANTSSNTESATSIKSSDLLNKYGDQVVGAYLADNTELALALGITDPVDSEGRAAEDLARKATGRLALMPVEVQKAFYAEVEEQYNNLIDYLNKTNQNELEPRTFDFDARETASQIIFEGDNPDSPFGSDAIYHEYSIKAQGKPMTPDEIRAEIAESLGGQDAKQHASDIVAGLDAQFGAFMARLTTDTQIEAANAARRRAGEFIRDHRIGSGWRVEINGDVYNAVVTNIRSTHKGAGNPFSMSKIQVTVALNGALRNVTVPATQFEGIEVASLGGAPSVDALFESAPKDERQTAKIITGNLLAAYGEISTKGTIINFTKADGSTEQGILLLGAFNPAVNTRGDYRIRTVADALKFLRESEDANIARFGIANREGTVRVVPEGSGVALVVPKSKAKGGKFFLNKKITDITGDFVSQGQTMRVTVPASKAADAVAVVMDMNALYALPSMATEAKKIVGEATPAQAGTTDAARYSVAADAAPALTEPALRESLTTGVIGPVVSRLIDAGAVVLHQDVSTLPAGVKKMRGIQAATTPDGKIHIVAEGVTAENARGVLLHESFHEGGENLVGTQQWNALMKRLDALRRQSEQSTGRAREFFDKARARVESAERRGAVSPAFAAEEFGAYAIEEYENAPAAVRKWVDDFIGAIKAWVLKRFGKQLGQITPAQLSAIAKMALMDAASARVEQVGALRFSAAPATGTPAFRAWFGDSAIKNADGSPKVMYHGTGADLSRFTPNNLGLIFVTPDTAFADVFAVRRPGDPGNANVLPVYVKAEKPFDASKPAHVKAVMQQIGDTRDATGDPITADRLAVAEWWALEDPAIVNAIKAAGFDGMYAMEAGIKNLAVFEPTQVKSAIGNRGTFDVSNPDIRYSSRSVTDTPAFKRWFGDSKVVDAEGRPLVVYHGTRHSFDEFKRDGKRGNDRLHYFSSDPAVASEYAGDVRYGAPNVMPAYVSLKKPFTFDAAGEQWGSLPMDIFPPDIAQHFDERNILRGREGQVPRIGFTDVIRGAIEAGYDGVIADNIRDGGGPYGEQNPSKVVVAHRPEQIKSATGNAGTFDPANPDIRYSVSPEEADRLIDVADKALDAAPDRLAKDDYIGRVVGDLSLGAKWIVHPRTVAAVHPEFTPVYLTAISQIETRDATIAELGAGAEAYNRLDQAGKENVNKALELGRLMSQTYKADELTAGITNTGEKTVVSVGEDGKPRMVKVPVEALLSGAGEVIKLTREQAEAYENLRAMFDRALDKMRDQTLDELGFPELAGKKNAAAEIAKMAKEEQGEKAERLKNIAVFVAEIEQAKRAGYVPFARYGDYVVTVKEKVADLTYVEDDAQHLIVQDVPASFAGDMLDLGAEETPEGWRIKKSQKASVERLTEKTVYSTKVETRIRDFLDERRAGKVDDIQPVREAIEKARAEYVGDNPNRRVVAFKAREKTPDAPVRLSDVDALAEVAQIDNATWDAVRDKLADAIKAKGFRRHFFHSDNVPGYTGDFERAIADYVIGMSGYLARRAHMKRWENSVTAIKDKPKLFQYASKYRDYVNSPQEEFAMIRQIGFFSYIAGVMASAFANLTQVPMLTIPTLAQVAPMPAVLKEVTRTYKDAMKMLGRPGKVGLDMFDPDKAPADVREALKEAWAEGAFVPLETYDLMMTARQRNTGARKGVKLFNQTTKVVSIAFTFAERLNRLVTFIAAARLAAKPAVQANAKSRLKGDALARREVLANWNQKSFAEWVVDESQYRMGKANRPTAMRGVGAALMQFKGYMIQTFEAWYRMAKLHGKQGKFAMAASLVTLYAFAGLWGLPGADDLRKLIENIYKQITKKDLDLKTELRAWVAKVSGSNAMAQIVSKGASYPLGVDLTRVGMGSVVPDSPLSAAGIPFDMLIGRPSLAFEKASSGDAYSAAAEFTPNFMKHWIVAGGWAVDGVRDKYGSRILRPEDLSDADIGMKALGFQPSIVTDIRDYEYAQRRQETAVDALKRRYTSQLAKALAAMETEDDPDEYAKLEQKVDEVYAEIDEHNESAPDEQQIVIGKRALDNRIQREAEGIRSTWGKERKNARGAAEDLRSLFGLSEDDEE